MRQAIHTSNAAWVNDALAGEPKTPRGDALNWAIGEWEKREGREMSHEQFLYFLDGFCLAQDLCFGPIRAESPEEPSPGAANSREEG